MNTVIMTRREQLRRDKNASSSPSIGLQWTIKKPSHHLAGCIWSKNKIKYRSSERITSIFSSKAKWIEGENKPRHIEARNFWLGTDGVKVKKTLQIPANQPIVNIKWWRQWDVWEILITINFNAPFKFVGKSIHYKILQTKRTLTKQSHWSL